MKNFPKHFHDGNEDNVIESNLPDEPTKAVKLFLIFIRQKLSQRGK
jgi:hypothetical protein